MNTGRGTFVVARVPKAAFVEFEKWHKTTLAQLMVINPTVAGYKDKKQKWHTPIVESGTNRKWHGAKTKTKSGTNE